MRNGKELLRNSRQQITTDSDSRPPDMSIRVLSVLAALCATAGAVKNETSSPPVSPPHQHKHVHFSPPPSVSAPPPPSPSPKPKATLSLDAMGVARARDGLVSWLELKITHMNATSREDARDMVIELVGAMQNSTEVTIKMPPPKKNAEPVVLDPIAVAKSQGALVSVLNEVVGHMNATSTISATTLVSDLIDSMADFTGIHAADAELLPGYPPSYRDALPLLALDEPAEQHSSAGGLLTAPIVLAFVMGVASAALAAAGVTYARHRVESNQSDRIPLAVRLGAYQSQAATESRSALLQRL